MEAIVLLAMVFVEIVVSLFIPMVFVGIELATTAVVLLFQLVLRITLGRGVAPAATVEAPSTAAPPIDSGADAVAIPAPTVAVPRAAGLRYWSRRIAIACAALSVISVLLVLAANFLFFEYFVRLATDRVAGRSGLIIDFEGAEGNFFTGQVLFHGMNITREDDARSNYDIHLDECHIDLSIGSILRKERRVRGIEARGVHGRYDRLAPNDESARKPFVVDHLSISNASLDVTDHTPPGGIAEVNLELETFVVDDYESEWAVRDVLFTSRTIGKIDGSPFEISNNSAGTEQVSEWKLDRLSVPLLTTYLGGAYQILREGNAQIAVTSRWNAGESNPKFDMHWRILLDELKLGVPPTVNPAVSMALEPLVGKIKLTEAKLPLNFHVLIEQQAFKGKSSLEAIGLKTIVRESAMKTLEEAVGSDLGALAVQLKDVTHTAVEKLREMRAERAARKSGTGEKKSGKGLRERMKGLFRRNREKTDDDATQDSKENEPGSEEMPANPVPSPPVE